MPYCEPCVNAKRQMFVGNNMVAAYRHHGKNDSSIGKDGKSGQRWEKIGYYCPVCHHFEAVEETN